jgi:hypothetical protein
MGKFCPYWERFQYVQNLHTLPLTENPNSATPERYRRPFTKLRIEPSGTVADLGGQFLFVAPMNSQLFMFLAEAPVGGGDTSIYIPRPEDCVYDEPEAFDVLRKSLEAWMNKPAYAPPAPPEQVNAVVCYNYPHDWAWLEASRPPQLTDGTLPLPVPHGVGFFLAAFSAPNFGPKVCKLRGYLGLRWCRWFMLRPCGCSCPYIQATNRIHDEYNPVKLLLSAKSVIMIPTTLWMVPQ